MSNNYLDYWIIAVIIILNLDLPDKLYLTFTTEDKVLEILRAIDTTKATGFDKFLEEFLKDFFDKISLRSNGPNVWKYGPENTLLCVACVKSQFPSDFFQTFVNCWIKTNKKKERFPRLVLSTETFYVITPIFFWRTKRSCTNIGQVFSSTLLLILLQC